MQNEDLFNARSVGVSSSSSDGFTASAEAGAMTGEFRVKVESMASRTEMSSKNRNFGRLAGGLDLNASIKDLALFTDITAGTFTIAGRTFSITNLNSSLQDVLNEINATFAGVAGVNPESDNTGITLEYDSVSDKFHFDTNVLSPLASERIPYLDPPPILQISLKRLDCSIETYPTGMLILKQQAMCRFLQRVMEIKPGCMAKTQRE